MKGAAILCRVFHKSQFFLGHPTVKAESMNRVHDRGKGYHPGKASPETCYRRIGVDKGIAALPQKGREACRRQRHWQSSEAFGKRGCCARGNLLSQFPPKSCVPGSDFHSVAQGPEEFHKRDVEVANMGINGGKEKDRFPDHFGHLVTYLRHSATFNVVFPEHKT